MVLNNIPTILAYIGLNKYSLYVTQLITTIVEPNCKEKIDKQRSSQTYTNHTSY